MPLGFLVPAVLAGLAALVLPLLLHLRQRERQRPRAFPSLMFLSRLPMRTDRRKRVTDLPLLLLRLFTLALLIAAFARPFVRQVLPAGAGAPGLTVIAVDRSQSMGYRTVPRAVADAVAAIVAALPSGERIAVVGYGTTAEVLAMPTTDRSVIREALADATPLATGTRHTAALRAAGQLLAAEPLPGSILLITDAQQEAGRDVEDVALSPRTTIRVVPVGVPAPDNAAVAGVAIEWLPASVGRRGAVAVRLVRSGGRAPRTVSATLWVDGRATEVQEVSLPADGTTTVTYPSVAIPLAAARLEVRLGEDDLPADDRFHAAVAADATLRVLLVSEGRDDGRFVAQALGIGSPRMVVERRAVVDAAMLARSAVVWFQDVPPPSGPASEALAAWVAGGGGVVVAAGPRLAAARVGTSFLPATVRGEVAREGALLGEPARTHPALAPFAELTTDPLATVRVRAHPVLEANGVGRALLRYDDGTPALIAGAVGRGRAAVIGIPLELRGGDFPVQPSFLPFVRGVAIWASGRNDVPVARAGGDVWSMPLAPLAGRVRAPDGTDTPARDGLAVLLPQAGFHALLDGPASEVPIALTAVNAPVAEADLRAITPEELLRGVSGAVGGGAGGAAIPPAAELERRQSGWRWVLLAAALLLAAETWLASRGWRGMAAVPMPRIEGEGA